MTANLHKKLQLDFGVSYNVKDGPQDQWRCYLTWTRLNRQILSESIEQFYRNSHLHGQVLGSLLTTNFRFSCVEDAKTGRTEALDDLSKFMRDGPRPTTLVLPLRKQNHGIARAKTPKAPLRFLDLPPTYNNTENGGKYGVRHLLGWTIVNRQLFAEAKDQFYRNHAWTAELNGDVGNPTVIIHSESGLKKDFDDMIYAMECHVKNAPLILEDEEEGLESLRIGIDESAYAEMPLLGNFKDRLGTTEGNKVLYIQLGVLPPPESY
ncbi:hypothetical protein PTMSG1_04425 [Pyrenophora teres f. maculata]|nr:hypothetical protein PTMSG1_04425 [Pyrenophora teres f. maculata]